MIKTKLFAILNIIRAKEFLVLSVKKVKKYDVVKLNCICKRNKDILRTLYFLSKFEKGDEITKSLKSRKEER